MHLCAIQKNHLVGLVIELRVNLVDLFRFWVFEVVVEVIYTTAKL